MWLFDSLFSYCIPVQNICRKFQFASMNVSKVIAWRKLKKSILDCKISRFLKFSILLFWKIECFPIKNHLAFLTKERYDIELTNIKILDKNIVPVGGVWVPEGDNFYCYIEILILVRNAESAKMFQVQSFNGIKSHSQTRKIGFRVIASFIIYWLASKILISFHKIDFFLINSKQWWIFKKFQNLEI